MVKNALFYAHKPKYKIKLKQGDTQKRRKFFSNKMKIMLVNRYKIVITKQHGTEICTREFYVLIF